MKVVLMQKLDAMTPWHSLREYDDAQAAKWQASKYAAERKPGEQFPKYEVQGVVY